MVKPDRQIGIEILWHLSDTCYLHPVHGPADLPFCTRFAGLPATLQSLLIAVGFGIPLALMALVDHSPFRRYYSYLYG